MGRKRWVEPRELAVVRRRLEAWRRQGGKGRRIPAEIWRQATELAAVHGVSRIAQALRLNYDGLRDRVDEKRPSVASAGFVEVEVRGCTPSATCVVEFDSGSGSKLTLRFSDPAAIDLIALSTALLRSDEQ